MTTYAKLSGGLREIAGSLVGVFKRSNQFMSTEQVEAALNDWALAMETGDPDKVIELYHPQAVFIGTVAERAALDRTGYRSYFTDFFANRQKLDVEISAPHVQLAGDVATAGGAYLFMLNEGNERVTFPARYTFVLKRDRTGDVKILNHHSSANPQIKPVRQPLESLEAH